MKFRKFAAAMLGTMMMVTQTMPAAAAESDELLHLTFDEENVQDSSGKNNHGTAHSVGYTKGILGKAAHIQNANGSTSEKGTSYIDLPSSIKLGTNDLTVSLWYKTGTGDENGGAIFGNKDYDSGANDGFVIGSFSKNIRANFAFNRNRKDNTFGHVDDQWHHLAVSLDRDGDMTTYEDGVKKGSVSIADFKDNSLDLNTLRIGADGVQAYSLNDSLVDEVQLFSSVKSESDIKALYDEVHDQVFGEDLTGKTVLHAAFEGDGADGSGRENHGTVVGNPEFVEGISGKALHIVNDNGSTSQTAKQYIDFGSERDLKFEDKDFSLKFWTRSPEGAYEGGALISNKDFESGGNVGFNMGVFHNGYRSNFRAQGQNRKDIWNVVPLDDQWHSMIVNYDRDGMMTVYRDGAKIGESDISDGAGTTIDAGHFVVGADGYFTYGADDAYIDELYVTHGLSDTTNARKEYADGLSGYAIKHATRLLKDAETFKPKNPALIDAAKEKLDALNAISETGTADQKAVAAEELVKAADALEDSMPEYDPDLMLRVSFDESNANDTSGRGHNGTIHGTPAYEEGISGKAIRLANAVYGTETVADQYVDFGNQDDFKFGADNFSFSLWYKENKDNRECAIIGNKDWTSGSNVGWNLGIIGSGLRMNFTPADTSRQDIQYGFLDDAAWHHLAANIDREGNMTLYVDGVESGTRDLSGYAGKSIDTLGLVLGADANGLYGLQDATIDELNVYKRLMTSEEIEKQAREGAIAAAIREARESVKDDTSKRADAYRASLDKIEERRNSGETIDKLLTSLSLAKEAYEDTLNDPLITFNVLSDPHVEGSQSGSQNKNLKDALDDIEYLNPNAAAIMFPGDLTNGGGADQYEAFFDLMKGSAIHPIAALGNHDVRWLCSSEDSNPAGLRIPTCVAGKSPFAQRYLKGNRQFMPEDTPEGQLYFDQWIGGYHFITLNTEEDLKDQASLSDAQLDWLEKILEGSEPDKPIFLQIHQAFEGTADHEELDVIGGECEVRLKEILSKYPQSVIFTGHIHTGKDMIDVYDRPYGHAVDTPCFYYQSYGDSQAQIAYQVSVYEDDIVIRLRDFANDVWLDDYTMHVNLDAKDPSDDANDVATDGLTITAGSEESTTGGEGPAANLFDNDRSTIWHTRYNPDYAPMNERWVQVDLGKNDWVTGVRYQPRSNGQNGNILAGEIQVSKDGETWTTVSEFTWKDSSAWKAATFKPVEARYVRLAPTKTHGEYASGAELRITHAVLSEKEKLDAALANARAVDGDRYTEESFAALAAAIKAAQSVLDKENVTDEELAAARADLEKAMNSLEEVELVRIASFNIAAGKKPDLAAINAQMQKDEIDIAGLQEIDMFNSRNNFDMLERLGESGVYTYNHFQKAIDFGGGGYGIGTVSSVPMKDSTGGSYSTVVGENRVWQRNIVEIEGHELALYNTHLAWENVPDRAKQIEELIKVVNADPTPYKAITGDFNTDQYHYEFYPFLEDFNMANGYNGEWFNTFNGVDSTMQIYSIDNIITTRNLRLTEMGVEDNKLSDHNMLWAEFEFLDEEKASNQRLIFAKQDAEELLSTNPDNVPEQWLEELQISIDSAKDIIANENASQEMIDAALEDLLAKTDRITAPADKTELDTAIARAQALDGNEYTAETWTVLVEARDAAIAVSKKSDATALEVFNAVNALNKAIAELELADSGDPITLDILEFVLNFADTLNRLEFNDADGSFTRFEAARDEAKAIKDGPASQSEIDKASRKLNDNLLELRRNPDEKRLEELYNALH